MSTIKDEIASYQNSKNLSFKYLSLHLSVSIIYRDRYISTFIRKQKNNIEDNLDIASD